MVPNRTIYKNTTETGNGTWRYAASEKGYGTWKYTATETGMELRKYTATGTGMGLTISNLNVIKE